MNTSAKSPNERSILLTHISQLAKLFCTISWAQLLSSLDSLAPSLQLIDNKATLVNTIEISGGWALSAFALNTFSCIALSFVVACTLPSKSDDVSAPTATLVNQMGAMLTWGVTTWIFSFTCLAIYFTKYSILILCASGAMCILVCTYIDIKTTFRFMCARICSTVASEVSEVRKQIASTDEE